MKCEYICDRTQLFLADINTARKESCLDMETCGKKHITVGLGLKRKGGGLPFSHQYVNLVVITCISPLYHFILSAAATMFP